MWANLKNGLRYVHYVAVGRCCTGRVTFVQIVYIPSYWVMISQHSCCTLVPGAWYEAKRTDASTQPKVLVYQYLLNCLPVYIFPYIPRTGMSCCYLVQYQVPGLLLHRSCVAQHAGTWYVILGVPLIIRILESCIPGTCTGSRVKQTTIGTST